MIRATTLLIVLTLTGTPTATSLCIAWCGEHTSPGAAGAGCHRETTTTRGTPRLVAREHECEELLLVAPFLREDLQRVASEFAPDHAVVVVGHLGLSEEANSRPSTGAWSKPHAFRPADSAVLRL